MDSPIGISDKAIESIKALIVTQIASVAKLQESGSQDEVLDAIMNLRYLVTLPLK